MELEQYDLSNQKALVAEYAQAPLKGRIALVTGVSYRCRPGLEHIWNLKNTTCRSRRR